MLIRRGKVWSAKLRIAGTQVWKSLQTSDFELAVVRLGWLQASVTATRFEQKTATREGLIMTVKQNLDAIVRQWARGQLEVTEQAKAESSGFAPSDVDDQKDVYGDLLEAAHEHLTENHKWSVAGIADELVAKHALGLDQESPEYKRLCRDLLRARVDVLAEEMRRVDGTYPETQSFVAAPLPQVSRQRDEADEPIKAAPVGPSIEATFADYMREHALWRTQAQIEANLERFLDHVSLKKTASVFSITKPLISAWKAKRLTEVSATTTARNLRLFGHYCAWLSNEGHVSVDPSAKIGVAVRAQRAAKVRRKDFTPEQMRLISDALVKRRATARRKYLEEYFWICQVVLFSGMRSAEAWDLWTDRIQVTDGVPFFDLQESKERDVNLKTNTSTRRVPLHSGLIKLGFLSYLDERGRTAKTQKAVRLFPHVADSSPVSRFFMETLRKVGITDRALTLHSTRHCWETA